MIFFLLLNVIYLLTLSFLSSIADHREWEPIVTAEDKFDFMHRHPQLKPITNLFMARLKLFKPLIC